jgi:hypothetical protein
MTTVIVIVVVAVCLAGGLYAYLHGGPGGGRATYRTEQEVDRERLDRKLERDQTFEKAEEKFQQSRRPTHEEP